jgi:hydroxymethylbilane synthase
MTAPRPLIIGTRGSDLALWQAHHIADRLLALGQTTEIRIIKTSGDRIQDLAFDKMEGKGFFTKELEAELLAGTIDLAVHSCKDLETNEPAGLTIAAFPGRAACTELLLVRPEAMDHTRALEVKGSAIVGTSSARRKAQLKQLRPDVRIQDLRGNVPTRVEKLRNGQYDAIVLAKAGLDRLGLDLGGLRVLELDPRVFVPAPAQGALAIQTRREDAFTRSVVDRLNDPFTASTATLERRVLNAFHGGCQVPLGVHVRHTDGHYELWASGTRAWGDMPRRVQLHGTDPEQLAREAVHRLSAPVKPLRVVITRALEGNELIARTLHAHGITLGGAALLAPTAVPFTELPEHDRLFFTSPNAVRFFVRGGGDLRMAPCDAIGNGTAEEIRAHGGQAVFIGDGPDTPAIARAYVERFGQVRVLFPCATEGLGTVQKAMPQGHATDLHVYAMRPLGKVRPLEGDVVIVTSPSHADALHAVAPLHEWNAVVAMGTSTAARIKALSGVDALIPWSSTQMALVDAIFHLATETSN